VAGREHDPDRDLADHEGLAVREQAVPLAAVGRQVRQVVDLLPELLHLDDMLADAVGAPSFSLR
jgi:hypothetical protein